MLKYQNSPYFSQQPYLPSSASSTSLPYMYSDTPTQPMDPSFSPYAYSSLNYPKGTYLPYQNQVPVDRYAAYTKPPSYSPMSYYGAYISPAEHEKMALPYLQKTPSMGSNFNYKQVPHPELVRYDSGHSSGLDVDQYFANSLSTPSKENYTSAESEDIYDLASYNSSEVDGADLIRTRCLNGVGRPPKRNSSAKSYHNRTLDNDDFNEMDEKLLLELAPKYKNDWKKISKRMFRLNNKKFGLNFLRIKYKELADDNVKKRVRFTHKEDLMIAKYSQIYGHDWTKIAYYFTNRTPIMLKNRYYHMKKKNILDKLVKEVEEFEKGNVNVDKIGEDQKETLQVFTKTSNDDNLMSKRVSMPNTAFEINDYAGEGQLSDSISNTADTQNMDQTSGYSSMESNYKDITPEDPTLAYDMTLYERPVTIEEAQIDENQEPHQVSLIEKLERPTEEQGMNQPFGFPKVQGSNDEDLTKFGLFNEEDEDWFLRSINAKNNQV